MECENARMKLLEWSFNVKIEQGILYGKPGLLERQIPELRQHNYKPKTTNYKLLIYHLIRAAAACEGFGFGLECEAHSKNVSHCFF